jgi:hypothetical protein
VSVNQQYYGCCKITGLHKSNQEVVG